MHLPRLTRYYHQQQNTEKWSELLKWFAWSSISPQSDQTTFPIPSNPPLPLEIVSPVEDLLQQGDHGKGADEDEEQSSVSQQIPA